MQTRSQTIRNRPVELEVNIDFDGASRSWLANKIRLSDATYKYKANAWSDQRLDQRSDQRSEQASSAYDSDPDYEPTYNRKTKVHTYNTRS